ncbi:hypothetical protein [Leisingera sp. ANG-M1]|uniref:hypothetical protein n=1 Tax=Leisingera sp. ANG-M1 TaxID=1577895 RepID=UPI0006895026|nr:hypothetical protein [Leisingera sp. ANG-M1]
MGLDFPVTPAAPDLNQPDSFNQRVLDAFTWCFLTMPNYLQGLSAADFFSVLGTVSQSGGNPTGDLLERGSNANGEYVRLADGTQICTHRLAAGTGGDTRWTFPASFAAAPQAFVTPISGLVRIGVVAPPASTTSYVDFNCLDGSGARQSNNCALLAAGRWF